MSLEKDILDSINGFVKKNICIVGSMPHSFYTDISGSLNTGDSVYIFDTIKNIQDADNTINSNRYDKVKILRFPISNKRFDWYGWHLLQYYRQLKLLNTDYQLFTALFYRGKHLVQYDMGTLPLAMKMIMPGGFLTVYDCSWSLAKSPTMKPDVNTETNIQYTKEQINIKQMQYLLDAFIDDDFVEKNNLSSIKTRVYCKKQSSISSDNDVYY